MTYALYTFAILALTLAVCAVGEWVSRRQAAKPLTPEQTPNWLFETRGRK